MVEDVHTSVHRGFLDKKCQTSSVGLFYWTERLTVLCVLHKAVSLLLHSYSYKMPCINSLSYVPDVAHRENLVG